MQARQALLQQAAVLSTAVNSSSLSVHDQKHKQPVVDRNHETY